MAARGLVAFRVDASHEIGTGHLARCLTLAGRLAERGFEPRFLTGDAGAAATASAVGFPARSLDLAPIALEAEDAHATLAALAAEDVAALVVDVYRLGAAFERTMRERTRVVVAIDDLANRAHDCDVLLDQNLHDDAESRYAGLVPDAARLLLGPKFALLRPEFAQLHASAAPRRRLERLLVSFGGSDPTHETEKTLIALREILAPLSVEVVVGGMADPTQARLLAEADERVTVLQGANMAVAMSHADLAIGAVGITSWERACLGLPAIAITVADNQLPGARSLSHTGAIRYLGRSETVTPEDIAAALGRLLAEPEELEEMSRAALALDIRGDGAGLVAAAIEEAVDARA